MVWFRIVRVTLVARPMKQGVGGDLDATACVSGIVEGLK